SRAALCPQRGRHLIGHTNHLVLLGPGLDAAEDESVERSEIIARAQAPEVPGRDWLLELLRSDRPEGVRRHATGGDRLTTLATFVVDLSAATVTVIARGAAPLELTIAELAAGQPTALQSRAIDAPPLVTGMR
ncbi:MAG: hypothetical protein ACRDL5_13245, partial [Solirubrobacteraceae bacterium]